MEKDLTKSNQKNIFEEIEDLSMLHYITKKFEHIIEYQRESWRVFEPSHSFVHTLSFAPSIILMGQKL